MNVVITSMRNEADYILEWVAWNIYIGFDKVVIFTNDNDDDSLVILKKLKKLGYIDFFELTPPKDAKPQIYAFRKGVEWLHEHKPNWVACLDADEYLVLNKDENLDSYLDRFSNADAIAINWKIFGSGNIKYKGEGLTIERFLFRAFDTYPLHGQFKSIFRYKEGLKRFHHRVFYDKENYKYIYSNGIELSDSAKKPGFKKEDKYIDYDYAQINHYTIRSFTEFLHKMDRGNGFDLARIKNSRHEEYLKRFDKNDVYDVSILDHLEGYIAQYEKIKKEFLN